MKWSWRIGTIAGIGVYIHFTFLFLLVWVGTMYYARGDDVFAVVHGLVFLASIFGIVVLHELGHALAARRYGIQTRDITLLPIGGVARLERMPDDPKQEFVVALAGPAVNVVLAALCLLGIVAIVGVPALGEVLQGALRQLGVFYEGRPRISGLADLPLFGANFLGRLMFVNVILVVFNMLPAFPMDGGRVLRALLAMTMDYVRATQMAATVGQGMALLFGFLGLMVMNPILLFIALFVWLGAAAESSMVEVRWALGGIPASRAMVTRFQALAPDTPLSEVVRHILGGFQQDFPVVENGHPVGMLTRGDILKALAEQPRDAPVSNFMQREFARAEASEMLQRVFERLQTCNCHSLPVVSNGDLVGVIDMENLGEFIAIRSAIHERKPEPPTYV